MTARTNNIKKISFTGLLLAIAMIVGIIENLIPPIIPFAPFVKLGLSNLIIIFIIIVFSWKEAITISILKSILVPLFVGNPIMILYSLPASIIATLFNITLINLKKISLPIISILGAITHNVVQLIVASIMISSISVFSFAPYLILLAIGSGFFIGMLATFIIKKMSNALLNYQIFND